MTTLNRLETNWKAITPLLLKKWPLLTPSDLDYIDGEFDRIVSIVRQRYNGVVVSVKEADIRNTILQFLQEIEASVEE